MCVCVWTVGLLKYKNIQATHRYTDTLTHSLTELDIGRMWTNERKKERRMRDEATGLAVELKNYVDIAGMIASDTFTQMDACRYSAGPLRSETASEFWSIIHFCHSKMKTFPKIGK